MYVLSKVTFRINKFSEHVQGPRNIRSAYVGPTRSEPLIFNGYAHCGRPLFQQALRSLEDMDSRLLVLIAVWLLVLCPACLAHVYLSPYELEGMCLPVWPSSKSSFLTVGCIDFRRVSRDLKNLKFAEGWVVICVVSGVQ